MWSSVLKWQQCGSEMRFWCPCIVLSTVEHRCWLMLLLQRRILHSAERTELVKFSAVLISLLAWETGVHKCIPQLFCNMGVCLAGCTSVSLFVNNTRRKKNNRRSDLSRLIIFIKILPIYWVFFSIFKRLLEISLSIVYYTSLLLMLSVHLFVENYMAFWLFPHPFSY